MSAEQKSEEKAKPRKFLELHKCTGCDLITNRPQSYMELIAAAGKVSCCPERRIIPIMCEQFST